MLIDSHCHLDSASAPDGPDPPLDRARAAGVRAVVAVGVGGLQSVRETLRLAAMRRDVVATVGVHPHEASSQDERLLATLTDLAREPQVVAIGEVGLDHHYDRSARDVQRAVLRSWVEVARRVRKPLVIHTRAADSETLAILREERARDVGGVIHCFSGDRAFATAVLDLGFDLSFSGIVTFPNAREVHAVAAWVPSDRVLVETDSPYLAPVPVRGRRNEPAHLVHTARCLARLRGISLEEVETITTRNACARFGRGLARAASIRQDEESPVRSHQR